MVLLITVSGRSAIGTSISKYGCLAAERERAHRKLEFVQAQRQEHVGLRTRVTFVGQKAAVPARARRAAFLPLAGDRVDALSNDIDGLSDFLKRVTGQCSEPDPGGVLGQRFYSRDSQEIVHLNRVRKGVHGVQ
jgi:hypothetical protein